MPSCWISGCSYTPGRIINGHKILLHCFPKSLERITEWLQHIGQQFRDLETLAASIMENKMKKANKYRLCSKHFAEDSYIVNASGRTLRANAAPTIFPKVSACTPVVIEDLSLPKKKGKRRSKYTITNDEPFGGLSVHPFQMSTSSIPCEENEVLSFQTTYHSCVNQSITSDPTESSAQSLKEMETQTDFTIENSVILSLEDYQHASQEPSYDPEDHCVFSSTPAHVKKKYICDRGSVTPIQLFPSPSLDNVQDGRNWKGDQDCILSPVSKQSAYVESKCDSSVEDDGALDNSKDASFNPFVLTLTSSEADALQLVRDSHCDSASFLVDEDCTTAVKDRKFIIFESCLDILISKILCQTEGCALPISNIVKKLKGSAIIVRGSCRVGHSEVLWNSQPQNEQYYSGNILLASSIMCSGLNFHKFKEFSSIFGLSIFSEKSFYRYQTKFIFPAIDIAWLEEKEKIRNLLSKMPICLAGDGQCDSPGHCAKYCTYTMMDLYSEKILDFEVVQRSQCTSSVAMEKYGFQLVMDRLLQENLDVCIFASDRHLGILKYLRENYPQIEHQYDVWHYSKSIRKKLLKESNGVPGRPIKPWIDKIVNHFWWCVQTCDHNEENFKERWTSVLKHIVNCHEWEDGLQYKKCSHNALSTSTDNEVLWLTPGSLAFKRVAEVVSGKQEIDSKGENCSPTAAKSEFAFWHGINLSS